MEFTSVENFIANEYIRGYVEGQNNASESYRVLGVMPKRLPRQPTQNGASALELANLAGYVDGWNSVLRHEVEIKVNPNRELPEISGGED